MQDASLLIDQLNDIILTDYYTFIGKLGSGAFGTVVMAQSRELNKIVAIKIIQRSRHKQQDDEAMILEQCDHPNIVKFYKLLFTHNHLFLIMEYLQGCTLDDFFHHPLTEKKIRKLAIQILNGLNYLHSNGIIHRDLKPSNIIFVKENQKDMLKLIDLGLGYKISSYQKINQICGTILYMAPEVAREEKYNQSVDIFAFGIILFQLFSSGRHPFSQKQMQKGSYMDNLINFSFQIQFPEEMSPMAKDFIQKTLQLNPDDRMTASQCLEHPFIKKEIQHFYPITTNEIIATFNLKQRMIRIIQALMVLEKLRRISIKHSITQASEDSIDIKFIGTSYGKFDIMSSRQLPPKAPRPSSRTRILKTVEDSFTTPQLQKRQINRSQMLTISKNRLQRLGGKSFANDLSPLNSQSPLNNSKKSSSPSPGFQTKSRFFFKKE